MSHYIFYNTVTGAITNNLSCSQVSKDKMIANNNNLGAMEGVCHDIENNMVNVSSTPHVVESRPAVAVDVPEHIRLKRQNFLTWCDWTQAIDSPLSDSKKAEWATYRQALRDLPTSAGSWTSISDVIWPSQPE
tara:strand:+ start:3318 stop:3716 length:399 start_codon:yes stop_codon:yes gene_type:complete